MNIQIRKQIELDLKFFRLNFLEFNSRMNYGMIGHIRDGRDTTKIIAILFEDTIYIHDNNFALTSPKYELIKLIQLEYANNIRDEYNIIVTVPQGIGAFE